MELSKKLNKEIIEFCNARPIEVDWQYDDELSKDQIIKILKYPENGLNDVGNEIWEMNLDYQFELEDYFIKETLYDWFKNELTEAFTKENPNESEEWIGEEIKDFLNEHYREYVSVDMNIKKLLNNVGELTCLIPLYSNYDCTNSFDTIETSDYLAQVYQRVKGGVKKTDFIWEHINGAYGGSLFCFAFRCDLETLIQLKKNLKTAKKIFIPKGTQFGYFSSFQGSGSPFEKTTYRNFYLNVKETGGLFYPDYDNIDIIADLEQHYSMNDVYGQNDFILSKNIELIN